MPRLFVVLLVVLVGLCTRAYAQSDSARKRCQNGLKVIPLRLVDPSNPGIGVAYERRISMRRTAQLTGIWRRDLFNVSPEFRNFSDTR